MQKRYKSITRKVVLFYLFIIQTGTLCAQTGAEVTIRIVNPKKEPVSFATVSIINRTDSLQSFTKMADSSGTVLFPLTKKGQYKVQISAVNYLPVEKGIQVTQHHSTFVFTAEPLGKTMKEVVVTSQRPLMRQEDDKTIVEPENLVATSTSGYEVIEKTPGLFVDQDGNIYISSMSPAAVQINGRDLRMSAADVATLLKSLPPDAIAKIEIVRTPSARYDASSSGGVVNIILKKGVKIGMTGSFNSGLQQGTYGNQFLGFNLNNNDGKRSSSLSFNYSRRNYFETIRTERLFAPDSLLSQDATTRYPAHTYFGSYRYGYQAGQKWELDLSTSISLNEFDNNSENRNIIKKISTAQTLTDNLNLVTNDGRSLNFRSAVNGKMKLDSAGSEWVNDVFFNITRNKAGQVFSSAYNFPSSFLSGGDGISDNRRNHLNLQSDLKLKMKKRFTLESGLKTSILFFQSETDYYIEQPIGNRSKDLSRTNTFRYNENINAAYLQGSKTMGKDIVLKTGLRLENTNMNGRQIVPGDTTFTIHRTDLFPYVYLSKNLMQIAGYDLRAYLVYRRTISRPGYDQLNPFARYVDQFLTEVGNPALQPQFNQNFEANISVDERPILAVGINDTRDIFTNVVYQADTSRRVAYRTFDNLGKNKEWYFRALGALPPGGKFFFVLGAQYNHNFYQGLYENTPLSFKRGTWTFFTYQMLKLDKRSAITLNGFMRLKGQQQFYELSSFGALNSSINRKFMKDKLVITLSMNDIFYTNQNDFSIKQGSVDATGTRFADTRRFGINIRYNFGIRKKEENNNDIFNAVPPGG